MGYEIPAGLGVRMAQPEGEVYVLIGDGTYLMNPTELVTAVQEGLKITVVVSENHGYQCIRRLQMWRTGSASATSSAAAIPRPTGWKASTSAIDLAANAASFGAGPGTSRPRAAPPGAAEARTETGACVIVAEVENITCCPAAGSGGTCAAEVSQDAKTRELRAEYERDRGRLQRLHY